MKKILLLSITSLTMLMADFTLEGDKLTPVVTETTTYTSVSSTSSKYLEPITLPACDANNPEVQFIRSNADWNTINSSSKRIFCVSPGDYSSLGNINLTASGTATKRRYIILNNGNDLHPGKLNTNELAIYALYFNAANYWIIDRPSGINSTLKTQYKHVNGSSFNIINRAFTDNVWESVRYEMNCNNNTVQNSRFQNMPLNALYNDTVAVALFAWNTSNVIIKNNKIINNEIVDCNDGFQAIRNPMVWLSKEDPNYGKYQDGNFEGTIVDGNDIYITPKLYTNGSGVFTEDGTYAFAENAIDLKIGSTNQANPMIISNNHLWGYRKSDGSGSSELSSAGPAISTHYEVKYLKVLDNVIFDSASGINAGAKDRFPYAEYDWEVKRNLIYNTGAHNKLNDTGRPLSFAQGKLLDIQYNVIINSRYEYAASQYNSSVTFNNNTIINYDEDIRLVSNYQSDFSLNDLYKQTADEVGYTENYVFTTDKFTNSPREITLTNALKPN